MQDIVCQNRNKRQKRCMWIGRLTYQGLHVVFVHDNEQELDFEII